MSGRLNIYMWNDASKFTLQMVNINKNTLALQNKDNFSVSFNVTPALLNYKET